MTLIALLMACTPSTVPGSPIGPPDRDAAELPPPPRVPGPNVVINEFQADNQSTWQDPDTLDLPDWVELYNAGTTPALLADLSLVDSSGSTWRGPDDEKLAPGERLFLVANGGNGDYELPFYLSAAGDETLALLYRGARADIVPVGVLGRDLSMARFPDGGDWMPTARPTPGFTDGNRPPQSLDPSDLLFQPYVMHEMDAWVDRKLFGAIDDRIPEPCALTVDGIFYPKVTIQNTGGGSFDSITGKPRLVFNLDAYDTTARFRGVDNIELHNGRVLDETRGRDWATYRLFELMGAPSSRVGFTHLTLNGEDYGLYVMVEDPDGSFVSARFPEAADTGMIFEGDLTDFGKGNPEKFDYEVGPMPPDPDGVESIVQADRIAGGPSSNANVADLWRYVLKDEMLGYLAVEGVANNSDGYLAPHNWRFYVDGVSHMIQFVPAGVEITWIGPPTLWNSNGNIAELCIGNTQCKRDYAMKVLEVADVMEADDFASRFADLEDWLLPYIQADPRKFATMQQTRTAIDDSLQYMEDAPDDARADVYETFPDLRP